MSINFNTNAVSSYYLVDLRDVGIGERVVETARRMKQCSNISWIECGDYGFYAENDFEDAIEDLDEEYRAEHPAPCSGRREFRHWLTDPLPTDVSPTIAEGVPHADPIHMNCTDFVFLVLYHAELLSREQIQEAYRRMMYVNLSSSLRSHGLAKSLGFDLELFRDVTRNSCPQPGDIVLVLEEISDGNDGSGADASHIFIAVSEDSGVGLWADFEVAASRQIFEGSFVDMFRRNYADHEDLSKVKLMYCPLQEALDSIGKNGWLPASEIKFCCTG